MLIKKDIDTFIKEHTRIRNCSSIIYPDGKIAYVRRGHIYHLEDYILDKMNITLEQLEQMIDLNKNYTFELIKLSNLIVIKYEFGYIKDEMTLIQAQSLLKLLDSDCISPNFEYITVF